MRVRAGEPVCKEKRTRVLWRLAFTSYYGDKLIQIDDLIVEQRTGPCKVLLRKQNETLYIVRVLSN